MKLATRPLLTQSVTTAVLFATGDTMAQQLVEKKGLKNHEFARTGRMAFYGGGMSKLQQVPFNQLESQIFFLCLYLLYLPLTNTTLFQQSSALPQQHGSNSCKTVSSSPTKTSRVLHALVLTKHSLHQPTFFASSPPWLSWKAPPPRTSLRAHTGRR
jgi:hypothetical protein